MIIQKVSFLMCTNESFVVYIFILCPIVSIADSDLSELWFYILCSIVSIADSDLSELWLYILLSCSIVVLYIVSYCVYCGYILFCVLLWLYILFCDLLWFYILFLCLSQIPIYRNCGSWFYILIFPTAKINKKY